MAEFEFTKEDINKNIKISTKAGTKLSGKIIDVLISEKKIIISDREGLATVLWEDISIVWGVDNASS